MKWAIIGRIIETSYGVKIITGIEDIEFAQDCVIAALKSGRFHSIRLVEDLYVPQPKVQTVN